MDEILQFLVYYLIIVNIISFMVCIYDKHKAKTGGWRIRESTLWILSLSGGAAAMLFAMKLIRHKTKHTKFMVGIPAILFVQIMLLILLFKFLVDK